MKENNLIELNNVETDGVFGGAGIDLTQLFLMGVIGKPVETFSQQWLSDMVCINSDCADLERWKCACINGVSYVLAGLSIIPVLYFINKFKNSKPKKIKQVLDGETHKSFLINACYLNPNVAQIIYYESR